MLSHVMKMDQNGCIDLHAAYTLAPKHALKCAVLQHQRKMNTWMYHHEEVNIQQSKHLYASNINENTVLFVKK